MPSYSSKAGMEVSAPLVNDVINDALFHSSPHISQTLHKITRILRFCLIDSLLNAPDFVVSRQ